LIDVVCILYERFTQLPEGAKGIVPSLTHEITAWPSRFSSTQRNTVKEICIWIFLHFIHTSKVH